MEGDTSFIETLNQCQSYHRLQQHYPTTHSQEGISRKRKRKSHYDAIPMSYSELLPQLVQRRLLTILPFKEVVPPYPNGFNPNACCMYHGGTTGHPTNDCNQLKERREADPFISNIPQQNYTLLAPSKALGLQNKGSHVSFL
ncbi:hypothetical protein Lal_00033650 [Lupinus albus]|nr:hypothetical protein Lal_00033650 [Lupinus albus]